MVGLKPLPPEAGAVCWASGEIVAIRSILIIACAGFSEKKRGLTPAPFEKASPELERHRRNYRVEKQVLIRLVGRAVRRTRRGHTLPLRPFLRRQRWVRA